MKSKKIILIISVLFSTAFVFAEGIGGSGSNISTPAGGKAKPSQDKIKGRSAGTPHKPKSIDLYTDNEPMPGTLGEGSPPMTVIYAYKLTEDNKNLILTA